MNYRENIKAQARYLNDIEQLEKRLRHGFFKFESNELKLKDNYHCGSAIEGSVNQRMSKALRLAIDEFDKVLREEAISIINEYEGKTK